MFGNLPGWIIAGILALSTTSLIWWKGRPAAPPMSQVTGELKTMMAKVALTPEPRAIVPPGTDAADAATHYRAAAERVEANKQAYKAFDLDLDDKERPAKPKSVKHLQADVDLLVAGAACSKMTLFAGSPGEVVNYKQFDRKPLLRPLKLLSEVALALGVEYGGMKGNKEPSPADVATARKYYEAVFHLGRFLYEERQAFVEYDLGLYLLESSSFLLSRKVTDPAQSAALVQLNAQCGPLRGEQLKLVHKGFYAIGSSSKGSKPLPLVGDVFEVATKSPEPMWQAQAVLRLGVLQRSGGVSGHDQFHARKILDELAARTDLPANVKAAVAAAKTMVETPTMTPDQKLVAEAAFNLSGGNY